MIGFAPPQYYSGGGFWRKSAFHQYMHQAILDLNKYVSPHLSLMDATIGLADYHLGGRKCSPPVNKIVAGLNPYEVDRKAAEFLKFNWKKIKHLNP
jgi:uncharacterized protein (DUF362 family)